MRMLQKLPLQLMNFFFLQRHSKLFKCVRPVIYLTHTIFIFSLFFNNYKRLKVALDLFVFSDTGQNAS